MINTSKEHQKFEQYYNSLNENQRKAVDTIYGPVMVLAGPGTGKTQILAVRIANLLRSEAQINPSEILCITFTDAGRIAMRSRLNEIVGIDVAQKIAIHTFHSFCNDIIQNNLSYFDKDSLEQASELEQFTIIKKMLDELPHGHLFKNPKNPYDKTKDLLYLFSKMKQENWTSKLLMDKVDEYITEIMPLDDDLVYKIKSKAGQRKAAYAEQEERMLKTKIAASLYDVYIAKMLEANRYDFNDMIQWVVNALATHEDLRLRYAEQFQYILVDEYQDTNGAQNELIRLLCSETDSPNLFVVGDDDQSIYRFQGANLENMESIKKRYTDIQIIQLAHNYRSYAEILNAAELFINKNKERLKSGNQPLQAWHGEGLMQPKLIGLQNPRQEMVYLATEIKKLIDKKILPKEIAVLFFKNEDCITLSEYLHHLDIPFYTKSKTNLLLMPLSKCILDVLRYINAECDTPFSGDLMLFQILHFHFFKLNALDIAKENLKSNSAAKTKDTLSGSLREYLQGWMHTTNPAQFVKAPKQEIIKAFATIENLIGEAQNNNLFPFFRKLIKDCGVYEYIIAQPNKIDLLDELTALFAFIQEETRLNPEMTLAHFISLIDIMQANGIKVDYFKTLGKDNGVQLLTMHSSKGLEFEHVFVASCMAKNWENKRGNNAGLAIPANVFDEQYKRRVNEKDSIKLEKKEHDNEELRRLMYVAATRAKKQLTFSFYRKDAKDKELASSQFLLEFFPEEKAIEKAIDDEAVTTQMMAALEPVQLVNEEPLQVKMIEKNYIDAQLKDFTISVSALNNFIKCALHFYFVNILKVPSGLNENASFGSAIHKAMDVLYNDMKNNGDIFPEVDVLTTAFKKDMFKRRETFTSDGYKNKLDYGVEILKNLYTNYILQSNKIVKLEHPVNVSWNSIPLKGFLDKLEFTGLDVNIVDYKTGNFDGAYAKESMREPFNAKGEMTNEGGAYWRQGTFYNLLISLDKINNWNPISSEFLFVEPVKPSNEYKSKKYMIGAKDVDLLKEQILNAWEKIQRHDFYTGCNKDTCDWCTFVKEHELQAKLDKLK